jgi:muconolactone delta-isomerase
MKFLVLWKFQAGIRVGLPEVAKMLSDLRAYAKELREEGKLESYYHIVGRHGGAWIFDVESNQELEILLAKMPVYNFVTYNVHVLTEMGSQ